MDKEKPVSWSAEWLPVTLDCLSHEPGLYYNKGHGHISMVFLCLVYNATTNSYMILKIVIKREALDFHTLLNLSLLISWGCVLTLTQVIWPRSRSLHHPTWHLFCQAVGFSSLLESFGFFILHTLITSMSHWPGMLDPLFWHGH